MITQERRHISNDRIRNPYATFPEHRVIVPPVVDKVVHLPHPKHEIKTQAPENMAVVSAAKADALERKYTRMTSEFASEVLRTQNELILDKLTAIQSDRISNLQKITRAKAGAKWQEKLGKGLAATLVRGLAVADVAALIPGAGRFFSAAAGSASVMLDNSRIALGARVVMDKRTGADEVKKHLESRYLNKPSQYKKTEAWITNTFERGGNWQATLSKAEAQRMLGDINKLTQFYRHTLTFDRKDMQIGREVQDRLVELARLMDVQESLFAYTTQGKATYEVEHVLGHAMDSKSRDAKKYIRLIRNTSSELDTERRNNIAIAVAISGVTPLLLGGAASFALDHILPGLPGVEEIRQAQVNTFNMKKAQETATVRDFYQLRKNVPFEVTPHPFDTPTPTPVPVQEQAMPTFRQLLTEEINSTVNEVQDAGNRNLLLASQAIAQTGGNIETFFATNVSGKVSPETFSSFVQGILDKNITQSHDVVDIMQTMPYVDQTTHQLTTFKDTFGDMNLLFEDKKWNTLTFAQKQQVMEYIRTHHAVIRPDTVASFVDEVTTPDDLVQVDPIVLDPYVPDVQDVPDMPDVPVVEQAVVESPLVEEIINLKDYYTKTLVITNPVTGKVLYEDSSINMLPHMPTNLGETPTYINGRLQDVTMASQDTGLATLNTTDGNTIFMAHRTRLNDFGKREDALGKIWQDIVGKGDVISAYDAGGRMATYEIIDKKVNVPLSDTTFIRPTSPENKVITLVTCYVNERGILDENRRVYLRAVPVSLPFSSN